MCSKGPKMVAIRNYHGTPVPPGKMPLCFQTGEVIELLKGDPDTSWWEVWYYKMNIYHVYIACSVVQILPFGVIGQLAILEMIAWF